MILAICSLLLTACGQIDDAESKPVTTTTTASESPTNMETLSAKEEKDTSEASTTTLKTSSQTVSSASSSTDTAVTTTKKSGSSNANGNSNQGQNNSVQNNNGQGNNHQENNHPAQNDPQPDNSPSNEPQSNNGTEQNNRPSDNNQNNDPSPPATTAKPVVTNPPTTTTPKPQTTVPQTEPPEVVIEDTTNLQSVLNYVNSLGRTTDEYYNIGAVLGHDGSDYGKVEAVYNWIRGNVSGNCQVFSVATMYACKGVGLECRYAFFSPDDWYGHMANLVCVEGTWYVFDTQSGRFLKSDKYGEITRIFDENDNTIDISISESAY